MPDMISPVGAMVQPVDPSKALSPLSSILGLQQQRQALQTGAITQQTAAAISQQQQLEAQKQQGVQNFFERWDPSEHLGNDGTTDLDSVLQDPQFKASGNAKPAIMQSLLDIKNHQLGVKQQLTNLNGELVKQFTTQMGALKTDPDVVADKTDPLTGVNAGRAKFNEAMSNFSQLSPDAARVAQLYGQGAQHAPPGKLSNVITALQLQGQSASEQQAQQNPQPMSIDTGGQTNIYNVNKATGLQADQQPVQSIRKAPQQVTLPTGQIGNRNPGTGAISIAPTSGSPPDATSSSASAPAASAPNINPTRAQVDTQIGLARGVTDRVSQAQSAANNTSQAQDALTRARAILDNPEGPDTGTGFENKKSIMNFLSSVGIDTKGADDANTLAKNLARYEAARATQAGLGGTDAARELAHNGSPNVTLDNKALKGVITQSLATEKALAAYANVQSRSQDPAILAKNESDFRKIPNLIQGYEYGLARNPKEADEFLQKHGLTKAEMAPTWKMIKEFEARGQ